MTDREQDEQMLDILAKLAEAVTEAEELAVAQPSYAAKVEQVEAVIDALCHHVGDLAGRYGAHDGEIIMGTIRKSAGW